MTQQAPAALTNAISTYLRRYHRHEIQTDSTLPETPSLLVANHGFGGIVDLNALALSATLQSLNPDREVTFLVHQLAWTLGLGHLVESLGGRRGSAESVEEAFSAGRHVAV